MPERSDHPTWPSPRGPWHEVTDLDRIFDYGAPWCINAPGHPGPDDDYPDPETHYPHDECHTRGLHLSAAQGLTGEDCELDVYAAQPYRFGEPRTRQPRPGPRIVFDLYDDEHPLARYSLTLGDATRIAMHLIALVRSIDGL